MSSYICITSKQFWHVKLTDSNWSWLTYIFCIFSRIFFWYFSLTIYGFSIWKSSFLLLITAMAAAMNFGPFKSWIMEFPEVVSFCEDTLEDSLGRFPIRAHRMAPPFLKALANQRAIFWALLENTAKLNATISLAMLQCTWFSLAMQYFSQQWACWHLEWNGLVNSVAKFIMAFGYGNSSPLLAFWLEWFLQFKKSKKTYFYSGGKILVWP